MDTDAVDYQLPPEAIAQVPVEPRDAARLLVDRGPGRTPTHAHVRDLPGLVGPGDVVVVNTTRVLPARLLVTKPTGGVVTASSSAKVREVIETLKKHGISQLPVLEGTKLRGMVHEVDLLRHLVQGKGTLDSTIAELVESDYATVTPSTKVELLKGVLNDAKIAIVTDRDAVIGVITKIDLIDFLARRAVPAAT